MTDPAPALQSDAPTTPEYPNMTLHCVLDAARSLDLSENDLASATPIRRVTIKHRLAHIAYLHAIEVSNFLDELSETSEAHQARAAAADQELQSYGDANFEAQWRLLTCPPDSWDDLQRLQDHIRYFSDVEGESFPNAWDNIPEFVSDALPELKDMDGQKGEDSWHVAYRIYIGRAIKHLRYKNSPVALSDFARRQYERDPWAWKELMKKSA